MNAPILTFDIETIPDVEALRASRGFSDSLSDAEVVQMDARLRRQERNNDFLPPHFQRVAVISCVIRFLEGGGEAIKILSFAPPEYEEAEAVRTFFRAIDKYTPRLASWNGGGFDLPVLHWRAMKFGIAAPTYWKNDGEDSSRDKFRWNNYTSRYHERHTDVMDSLALYQPRAFAGLEDAARLCGLPGKIGIGGAKVWDAWRKGETAAIRRYCETDAMLTWLLFVRFQYFRGAIPSYAAEEQLAREHMQSLADQGEPQWAEFLSQWEATQQ